MTARKLALLTAPVALAGLVAGCGPTTSQTSDPGSRAPKVAVDNPAVSVGSALFKEAADVAAPAAPPAGGRDALVMSNCTVQYEERQQVGAEVDGLIDLIATPFPDGTRVDPNDPTLIFHPRDVKHERPYRRLRDGDPVKVGQVIAYLDDQIVTEKMAAAKNSKAAAEDVLGFATEGVKLSAQKLDMTKELIRKGVSSQADLIQDLITMSRFQENLAQAKQTISKATSDFSEAEVMLGKHRVRSHVNGFIRSISRQPGEFVKQGEKIMEIQATDTVRVEGNLESQYASAIGRGTAAVVEPATPRAPDQTQAFHRQEVTGLAVTAHPKRPLVVSTGADGAAVVWDVANGKAGHNLPHPVAARAVACTPPGALFFRAVTGADDGKVRVWDLSDADKLPAQPAREGAEAHSTGVTAVAFSPDGRHFATAAGREIFVWETETGKRLYDLKNEHRDTVTSLAITPQCTLVSAARDRTIKVWKLGADRAAVAKSIDHRAGAVDTLAVSTDGGRVLFDQDKGRIDVVNLADKQTLSQVLNPGSTAAFATFALFSPDDRLIATAGGEGELKGGVQVWSNPAPGGRGSELARLIAPGRAAVTCAAFSPPSAEAPFVAVGTSDGRVHLWTRPGGEADRKAITGAVTKVDATDPRYVTVRVEIDNRALKLLDRSQATVIINPAK